MKTILYISYDGLTDHVGQSQILPYLKELTKKGYTFHILSCEKPLTFAVKQNEINSLLKNSTIFWHYTFFHSSPPIFAKLYDLFLLKKKAKEILEKNKIDIIHCRSYVAAELGFIFKRKYNKKFIFDLRGFWVDERVEGGIWNKQSLLGRFLYRRYKAKEANYISESDAIVSLTETGKKEIQTWSSYKGAPITVIPCAADYSYFSEKTTDKKNKAREKMKIPQDALVLGYLGSLGTWYMLDELIKFYGVVKQKYNNAFFLILTAMPESEIVAAAKALKVDSSGIIVKKAAKAEVAELVCAFDISPLFIKPVYSKKASSPIKAGELSAIGIPMIANSIGDMEAIITSTQSGIIVNEFTLVEYERICDSIPELLKMSSSGIRERTKPVWDLQIGVEKYDLVYKSL